MPLLHSLAPNSYYLHRLVVIFLTFAPAFVILTISYEGLFYFAYSMTVLTWVRLEHKIHLQSQGAPAGATNGKPAHTTTAFTTDISTPAARDHLTDTVSQATNDALVDITTPPSPTPPPYRSLGLGDIRIALFFLFLLQAAFFSTGNIASISSFSLDAVYRLIPVFDPFSQGALLLLKLLIPFVTISAGLGILNRRLGVAPSALFMLVTACSEVMTIGFFYRVRDEGSWLDIGTSISHFAISSLLGVFVSVLELGGEWLVGGVEFDEEVGSIETKSVNQPGDIGEGNGKVNGKEVGTEDLY
jgi:phosphatidylinositol glycan class N